MIDNIEPPEAYVNAMKRDVRHFTDNGSLADLLSQAKIGLPVLSRTLDDAEEDRSLEVARESDNTKVWRFLAEGNDGKVVAGEVSDAKGVPRLVNLWTDPRIVSALRAIKDADGRKELEGHRYEVKVLRITGVLVEALWFQSDTGKSYVVPILAASKELRIGDAYDVDEFVAIVRGLAPRFRKLETARYVPPKTVPVPPEQPPTEA